MHRCPSSPSAHSPHHSTCCAARSLASCRTNISLCLAATAAAAHAASLHRRWLSAWTCSLCLRSRRHKQFATQHGCNYSSRTDWK